MPGASIGWRGEGAAGKTEQLSVDASVLCQRTPQERTGYTGTFQISETLALI